MDSDTDVYIFNKEEPAIRPEPTELEEISDKPLVSKRIKAEFIFFIDCFLNIQKRNPEYLITIYSEGGWYKAAGYVALWAKNYEAAVCNYRKAGKHNVADNIINKVILKQNPQRRPQSL